MAQQQLWLRRRQVESVHGDRFPRAAARQSWFSNLLCTTALTQC